MKIRILGGIGMEDYTEYFNQGNDCDCCENQYLCGEYGTVTACHRADTGLSCEFVERSEN